MSITLTHYPKIPFHGGKDPLPIRIRGLQKQIEKAQGPERERLERQLRVLLKPPVVRHPWRAGHE